MKDVIGSESSTAGRGYSPVYVYPLEPEGPELVGRYASVRKKGEEFISQGKLGLITVAGGQGSRLGYAGPKGCMPISKLQDISLFQVFAERIIYHQKTYNTCFQWVIMCSPSNYAETEEFFQDAKFFGLESCQVHFITQGTLPVECLETGELIYDSGGNPVVAANGHGGVFDALYDSKLIDLLEAKGGEHLSYFQVDNLLATIIDPLFIGLHLSDKADFSAKVLKKRDPYEKLGNFVKQNGVIKIIEYMDFPREMAESLNSDGELLYSAGSPSINLYSLAFIRKISEDADFKLPLHKAIKKVSFVNEDGVRVTPEKPNAIKYEKFSFDCIPMADNVVLLEADRNLEFAPIKNLTGEDSIETAVQSYQKIRL